MQCGLIEPARQQGTAVFFAGDGQTLKPGGPPVLQVSFDANFIKPGLVLVFR